MQFFQYMKDIYLEDSYEQFVEKVNVSREKFLKNDLSLINTESKFLDIEVVTYLPNGQFTTIIDEVKFNCFFHNKEGKYLYVFLNGARKIQEKKIIFSRWSHYRFLNGKLLNIADPMFDLYPDLTLGWYYGNNNINLREKIAKLVKKIAEIYAIKNENIVFFGSSGGGAATFECANYIEGAKAVALNPQMILSEWGYAETFTEVTGLNLNENKDRYRHNSILQLKNNRDINYILIFNLRSKADIKQCQNVCKEKNIRVKYGLNIFENIIIWIYDADGGGYIHPHSAQEYYCIWFFIQFLIENVNDKSLLKNSESLFRLGNEIWHEYYNQESRWIAKNNCLGKVLSRLNKKKKTGVFGIGRKADGIVKKLLDINGENYFNVQFAIDNSLSKRGNYFQGLPVLHPMDIKNWEDLYIIITSELYDKEIKSQLMGLGLREETDFISYRNFLVD